MAIKTEWDITYKCGHSGTRDLSAKPAGERAGYAEWLAKTDCFDCFKGKKSRGISAELKAERAAEETQAREEAERLALAVLRGSEKQVAWAMRVRHELLIGAYHELVDAGQLDDADYDELIIAKAKLIDRAGWWIDNREMAPGDLPELLADPGVLAEAASSENPF